MITIKAEHLSGWEWAAARAGKTVTQLAQQHLDQLGASFDRQAQESLFSAVLLLPEPAREQLKAKALELLTANNIQAGG
jgi:hypothetical protein